MTDTASNKAGLGAGAKLVIACGSAILLLAFGPRSTMGFFQQPILDTTGWSSATFGIAIAIQNLAWGLGQPVFGALATGMFLHAPISAGLIAAHGWSSALLILSAVMLIIPVLAIPLRGNSASASIALGNMNQTAPQALSEALTHKSCLLLNTDFNAAHAHNPVE